MACDKPSGDCTKINPCGSGSGCGCEGGEGSSFCPTIALPDGAYGYAPNDTARDPDATVGLYTCEGTTPFVWIYKKPKAGARKLITTCGGDVLGFAADGPYCLGADVPLLPKCQDVSLQAGTYALATVTVNSSGCISAVVAGDPPLYTPNDCCEGGDGGNGTGGRGDKGDPGLAATIDVIEAINTGSDNVWAVENIGTTSAAILQFTAPANSTPGQTVSGATGDICGLEVQNGLVKNLPVSLITDLDVELDGDTKAMISAGFAPGVGGDMCRMILTMNFDAFYNDLKGYIDSGVTENAAGSQGGRVGVDNTVGVFYNGTATAKEFVVTTASGIEVEKVNVPANGTVAIQYSNYTSSGEIYRVLVGNGLIGVIKGASIDPGGP